MPEALVIHLRDHRDARRYRSGCPCGRSPRCEIFAAVNNDAEAFGHAATHAPQPMHAAASIASSAFCFGIGMLFASCAPPVGALMKPPAAMIRSSAPRSTTRSLITGNARARHGSMYIVCAVLEAAHVQLAGRRSLHRPVRHAVDHHAARSANAFATIVIERDRRPRPSRSSRSLTTSSISRNDMSGLMSRAS